MPPTSATAYQYCTQDDIDFLLSPDGSLGRIDDDGTGTASAAEEAHVTRAIQWATARINLHCLAKYPAADLAQSWIINQWCSIIAAYSLSCRRGNPAAESLAGLYEAAMEDLKLIQSGTVQLPDVAMRDSAFPAWSNIGAPSLRHSLRKLRVQVPISGRKGDRSGQTTDLPATVIGPYEQY